MQQPPRITLISGIPGSGKTTLASALADQSQLGIHIKADVFHGFLAHPVDPYSPDSRAQAQAIARAIAYSARAFAEQGYAVFVDGVIGPWNLPVYDEAIESYDYAILDIDAETAINRMSNRGDVELQHEGVARLWNYFHKYPEVQSQHALMAAGSKQSVMQDFVHRRELGHFLRQGTRSPPPR